MRSSWYFLGITFFLYSQLANGLYLELPKEWRNSFRHKNFRAWVGPGSYPQVLVQIATRMAVSKTDLIKIPSEQIRSSLEAVRNAAQTSLGFGEVSIDREVTGVVGNNEVVISLEGTYVSTNGQRTYFAEYLFVDGDYIHNFVVTDPIDLENARGTLNKFLEIKASRMPSSDPEDELTEGSVCLECLSKETDGFIQSMKNISTAVDAASSQSRAAYCSKVKSKDKSKIVEFFGETEIRSWNDNFDLNPKTFVRKKLVCLASLPVGFARGVYEPLKWIYETGVSYAGKAISGAPKIFDTTSWRKAYDKVQKVPNRVRNLYASATNAWPAIADAARHPVDTGEVLAAALGKAINGYLVNKVPAFLCLSPEARTQLICDSVGYLAGNFTDLFQLFKLLKLGKFLEASDTVNKVISKFSGKYWSIEKEAEKGVAKLENPSIAALKTLDPKANIARVTAEVTAPRTAAKVQKALKAELKRAEVIEIKPNSPKPSTPKPPTPSATSLYLEKFSKFPQKDKEKILSVIERTYTLRKDEDIDQLHKLLELLASTGETTLAKAKEAAKKKGLKNSGLACPVAVAK